MWKVRQSFPALAPTFLDRASRGEAGTGVTEDTDFIAVDDGGSFTYIHSVPVLAREFEYPQEAMCIIDRQANNYPLRYDQHRRITLGPSVEKADLNWLRHAWEHVQDQEPGLYPLRRSLPADDAGFLAGLFETLELSAGLTPGPWLIHRDGRTSRRDTLADVSELLMGQDDPSGATIEDPQGHLYRPARHTHGRFPLTRKTVMTYTETARAAT